MSSEPSGIYSKYKVERTDGSSAPGGKHDRCAFFVLDLEHDPFAIHALKAYARACRKSHPDLARDIDRIVENTPQPGCGCREAFCPHTPIAPDGHSEMAHHLMASNERRCR
jgi:hypothetical protein